MFEIEWYICTKNNPSPACPPIGFTRLVCWLFSYLSLGDSQSANPCKQTFACIVLEWTIIKYFGLVPKRPMMFLNVLVAPFFGLSLYRNTPCAICSAFVNSALLEERGSIQRDKFVVCGCLCWPSDRISAAQTAMSPGAAGLSSQQSSGGAEMAMR